MTTTQIERHYDVIIIGAGLAGLTLARQLLLNTGKTILHLDREPKLPIARQKLGESNVQVQGYYLGKVLDLEEHLYHDHVMKYNLRFMWKAEGTTGANFEDYSQSYIRQFSNIPSYQLDRNLLEGELIRRNREDARYLLLEDSKQVEVSLGEGGNLQLKFEFFNVINRVNLGGINANPGDPNFGRILGQNGNAGPRVIQIGARVAF